MKDQILLLAFLLVGAICSVFHLRWVVRRIGDKTHPSKPAQFQLGEFMLLLPSVAVVEGIGAARAKPPLILMALGLITCGFWWMGTRHLQYMDVKGFMKRSLFLLLLNPAMHFFSLGYFMASCLFLVRHGVLLFLVFQFLGILFMSCLSKLTTILLRRVFTNLQGDIGEALRIGTWTLFVLSIAWTSYWTLLFSDRFGRNSPDTEIYVAFWGGWFLNAVGFLLSIVHIGRKGKDAYPWTFVAHLVLFIFFGVLLTMAMV